MDQTPIEMRQLIGCGYLPRPAAHLLPMVRPFQGCGMRGDSPTTCPGYTSRLPEVIEVARVHRHWSKGNYDVASLGVDHPLVMGLEILDSAANALESWTLTPESKGGGRKE